MKNYKTQMEAAKKGIITEEMKIGAAKAIASLVTDEEL